MARFTVPARARRLATAIWLMSCGLASACSQRNGEIVVSGPSLALSSDAVEIATPTAEQLHGASDAAAAGQDRPSDAAARPEAVADVTEPSNMTAASDIGTTAITDVVEAVDATAPDAVATAAVDASDVQVADLAAADLPVSIDANKPAPVDAVPAKPDPPAWQLTWSDEFNGAEGSAADPARWSHDVGCGPDGDGWGNGELQWYGDGTANAVVKGGALVITAKVQAAGAAKTCVGPSAVGYSSARLHTQAKFAQKYGRFEARMQIPAGIGLWSAFWLMGADYTPENWPICGEIDVMENAGNEAASVHGAIHGPTADKSATGDTYVDEGVHGKATLAKGKLAEAFHVYAIEWEHEVVRWYLDDKLFFTAKPGNLPAGATWVFDHPFFLVVNLAIGGAFPDPPAPDATTVFPKTLVVDWVRVYQKP